MEKKQKGTAKVTKAMMLCALDQEVDILCPGICPVGLCRDVPCNDCKEAVLRALLALITKSQCDSIKEAIVRLIKAHKEA